jgi:hypothetical protein
MSSSGAQIRHQGPFSLSDRTLRRYRETWCRRWQMGGQQPSLARPRGAGVGLAIDRRQRAPPPARLTLPVVPIRRSKIRSQSFKLLRQFPFAGETQIRRCACFTRRLLALHRGLEAWSHHVRLRCHGHARSGTRLTERQRVKRQTIANRRLQPRREAPAHQGLEFKRPAVDVLATNA